MRKLIVAFALAALAAAGRAQVLPESTNMATQGRQAATASLGVLRALVSADNYVSLGFESAKEVESASIGEALPVYLLRLDAMRAYQPGQDAEPLLQPSGRAIYPVLVGGAVRTSIEIAIVDGKPTATSLGAPRLATLIARQRDGNAAPAGEFIVHAAALGIYFVGRRTPTGTTLTPILDDARADLVAGRALPLATALERLAVAARTYNGLPL